MSLSEIGESHRTGVFTLAVLASAAFTMLSPAPLRAQQKPARGTIIVPATSVVRPQDRGLRAHTNHLIFIPAKGNGNKGGPPGGGNSGPAGETPGSLACVYQTASSLTPGCPISTATYLPVGGSGVIAIVDAYDYPTASSDFNTFSTQFGLPTGNNCNGGKPCFQKVWVGSKPRSNGGWSQEAALDIEWSHAMAPNAQIVLVEAASNSFTNLLNAVQAATNEVLCGSTSTCPANSTGKGEVSMSWGGSEFSGETANDGYFFNSGVTYFGSSGDTGGVVIWPSASPNVVSAGGTTINRNSSGAFIGETAWSGTGGGPSQYEPEPSYQTFITTEALNGQRGTPDFSFDANPASGVSVYDSTSYQGLSGWLVFGGTSVASPSLAGIVNLTAQFNSLNGEQELIYNTYSGNGSCPYSSAFNDITSGTAGSYSAGTGWDFVTGVGSNKGITCGK